MVSNGCWLTLGGGALCGLMLLSPAALGVDASEAAIPPDTGLEVLRQSPRPDLKYPFFYSTSLMLLTLPVLEAADTYDSGYSVGKFERAFSSAPVWDPDTVVFNYVLHPLWGSETYLRARESHFGMAGSVAFSMGMSVTWEYLIESWVEQPSIQDLIFTTGIGWPLGELRYRLKQRTSDRMDWVLDPIQKALERMQIVAARDKEGKLSAGIGFAFTF